MVRSGHRFPELVFLRQSRNRRIGLFGGSFNPLHEGHWQCAEGLRKARGLDQVWWLPVRYNPLKKIPMQNHFPKRLEAIRSRISGHPKHRLSLLLIRQDFNYTIDFLRFLKSF